MTIRKTLTSIVLAGALALGVAGCKDNNQQNEPKQNIFPYTQVGQIAEVPNEAGYFDGAIGLAAADFDGDGDIDLAVVGNSTKYNPGKVFLYRNDGNGNYTNVGQIAEVPNEAGYFDGAIGLAAADFDGDGDIDLAVVGNSRKYNPGKVFLYRNDGVGKLIETK